MDKANRALGKKILAQFNSVVVVGISDNEDRASYRVAKYLIENGYDVVGVNPAKTEVLGRPCYPDLQSIPHPIEVVDVFRAKEFLPPIIDEAIKVGAKAVWLQEGLTAPEAEAQAQGKGLLVVHDICMKKLHESGQF